MNNEIEKILKNVKSDAISLEIFADSATSDRSNAEHKQRMLDSVVVMLRSLERLNAQLKQIMEGNTNA